MPNIEDQFQPVDHSRLDQALRRWSVEHTAGALQELRSAAAEDSRRPRNVAALGDAEVMEAIDKIEYAETLSPDDPQREGATQLGWAALDEAVGKLRRPLDITPVLDVVAPPFEWLVEQWLPRSRVALLAGDGGLGKSRLTLRLAAAIAAGPAWSDWLGGISTAEGSLRRPLRLQGPAPAIVASWEDDLHEVKRRLEAMRMVSSTTGNLHFVDAADFGPLWMPPDPGEKRNLADPTPVGAELRAAAEGLGARLLVIDPLAAAFAGNENDRGQVRAFMSNWDAWARRGDCAVLFVSHTPKTEAKYSGSTDWRNAARTVWSIGYEGKPKGAPMDAEPAIVLECEKSNYGAPPPKLYLSREGGVISEAAKPDWSETPETDSGDSRPDTTNGHRQEALYDPLA